MRGVPTFGDEVVDLGRPLGEQLADLVRDPRDPPAAQPSGPSRIRLDSVAEIDRSPGGGGAADDRGRVQHIPERRGVERLPPALGVQHLDDVGDEHVIMHGRVPGPARPVPGHRPRQPGRRRADLVPTPPSAPLAKPVVEELERCVRLGVDDGMHVIGPADSAEHGDGLVRRDDQLHPRPGRRDQTVAGDRVGGTAHTEDRRVGVRRHRAVQTETAGAGTAPRSGVSPLVP